RPLPLLQRLLVRLCQVLCGTGVLVGSRFSSVGAPSSYKSALPNLMGAVSPVLHALRDGLRRSGLSKACRGMLADRNTSMIWLTAAKSLMSAQGQGLTLRLRRQHVRCTPDSCRLDARLKSAALGQWTKPLARRNSRYCCAFGTTGITCIEIPG